MKKPIILIVSALAVAFGAITIYKWWNSEGRGGDVALANSERTRIKTFWDTYNRANAFRTHGDFAHAIPIYREALGLDPQHEDSLYYLGTSLEELGDYTEAAATLRRLIDQNPSSGRALGELGNILSLQAPGAPVEFDAARQAFQRNVEVNREQAGPFLRLGTLDLNQGHFDSALANYRIAARFGSPEGNFAASYVLFLQGKYKEAAAGFQKVLEAYGRDRKIIGKGVLSEGDLLPSTGKPLTPLENAGLKSMLFLSWTAARLGGYPSGVPKEFQIPAPGLPSVLPRDRAEPELKTMGGRAVSVDFDKDGQTDLLVVAPDQPTKLFRREGEKLVDVTRAAGLSVANVWDADVADYDGDGYPDLYLIRSGFVGTGQNLLYHNNRNGTFTDMTKAAGLDGTRATAQACFFDFDGDGRLDLLEVGAPDAHHAPVRLYRNTGSKFIEVTAQSGLASTGTAVGCAVADYDRDGKPDVFVLNWKQDAALFRNLGNGRFANVTAQAGLQGIRGESFSALFFDYDRDGFPDLLVTAHAPYEEVVRCLLQSNFKATRGTPRLFRNLHNGRFEDVSARIGLTRAYGTMQALAVDLDGDGWPDLVLANGGLDAQRLEPSVILRNQHGQGFLETALLLGPNLPRNSLAVNLSSREAASPREISLMAHPLFRPRP